MEASSHSSDYTDIHPLVNPFLLRAYLDCSMIRRREGYDAWCQGYDDPH